MGIPPLWGGWGGGGARRGGGMGGMAKSVSRRAPFRDTLWDTLFCLLGSPFWCPWRRFWRPWAFLGCLLGPSWALVRGPWEALGVPFGILGMPLHGSKHGSSMAQSMAQSMTPSMVQAWLKQVPPEAHRFPKATQEIMNH